jgi:hypothetical protein
VALKLKTLPWFAWPILAPALLACGGRGLDDVRPDPSAIRCNGKLGAEAVVVQEGMGKGLLLSDGDDVFIVEEAGRILRLGRCGDASQEIASGILARQAALAGDFVYFASSESDKTNRSVLRRVRKSGGRIEQVLTGITMTGLVARESTLYFMNWRSTTEPDYVLQSLEVDAIEPAALATLRTGGYKTFYLRGVSDAGLYVREDYDCGCIPGLQRLPFGSTELLAMPGSGGAMSATAVWDGELYFARLRLLSGVEERDIVKVPIAGGEAQIVVPMSEEFTSYARAVAVDEFVT